jgi:DNA primase
MYNGNTRKSGSVLTPEQTKRILVGIGVDIEGEVDTDYIVFCPFHGNYRTPAGEVDKYSGTFYCFSCQRVSDIYEYVMFVANKTYFEAARYIKANEIQSDLRHEIVSKLIEKPDYHEFDGAVVSRLAVDAMKSDRGVGYFRGRKISKESMQKFSLGYSESRDMVTVPVHSPDGVLVGFVGRSVEGKDFKNTPGLPKSKVLFNLHRVKNSSKVFVVESSFDVIRLDQVGIPAVATLGANVSKIQIDLLRKYFNNIYVVADNDEAGGNMKNRIIEKIGSRVSVVQLDSQYKDIGDMDDEAIRNIDISFDKSISAMLQ